MIFLVLPILVVSCRSMTMTKPKTIKQTCSCCGETKDLARIPMGWKQIGEKLYCKACKTENFVLRAIAMPIAEPLDCEWEELRDILKETWSASTRLANRIITELALIDPARSRTPEMEKIPKFTCLLYTSPSPRDRTRSRMPSSA